MDITRQEKINWLDKELQVIEKRRTGAKSRKDNRALESLDKKWCILKGIREDYE